MKEKYYLDRIDAWLEQINSDGLKDIERDQLMDARPQVDQYEYLFSKGLELIKSEPRPQELLVKILDEYTNRFADLPNLGSGSLTDPELDEGTKEKLKSLILFGSQAALIKENSRIQYDLRRINQNYMDLLSIVTHEFKHSLTSIYGYNKIINKRISEGKTEKLNEVTERVDKLSKNLFNLVETLLNMSMIEQKRLTADNIQYNLIENVLQPIIDELQLQLDDKQMAIEVIANEDDFVLEGDPGLLQIAIRNLVLNAIQYGFEKTDIEIRIEKNVDRILLEVYNKGLGLEKKYLTQIFEKFSRFHPRKKTSNVGIGLFTAKHIVESHKGTIVAESVPGEWMRFMIILPFKTLKGT